MAVHAAPVRFSASGDPPDDGARLSSSRRPFPLEQDELPYKVEIWDDGKASVEQILAVTASPSIGYAAYYAATREFPSRFITLRHKNSIISRWNGPPH